MKPFPLSISTSGATIPRPFLSTYDFMVTYIVGGVVNIVGGTSKYRGRG